MSTYIVNFKSYMFTLSKKQKVTLKPTCSRPVSEEPGIRTDFPTCSIKKVELTSYEDKKRGQVRESMMALLFFVITVFYRPRVLRPVSHLMVQALFSVKLRSVVCVSEVYFVRSFLEATFLNKKMFSNHFTNYRGMR